MRQYALVVPLLATDATIYWMRSQLFLVANAALMGFALNTVPISSDARTGKICAVVIGAVVGILLCILWRRTLRSGEKWMNHWKDLLRQWEPTIFGDINVYRKSPAGVPKTGTVAREAALLFLILWCMLGVYATICLCLRLTGRPLT